LQPIALLTDFGTRDPYVGVMKGVIQSIAPGVPLIDLSHAVLPQNVRQAAFMLMTTFDYFPAGTVFLVVVDPGVGSSRQALIVETDRYTFIAPDNGVLSYVLRHTELKSAVLLENREFQLETVSTTFHGRDIFAPAAAYAAVGRRSAEFGAAVPEIVQLSDPRLQIVGDRILGEVIYADHFGNLITSIGRLLWNNDELQLRASFGDNTLEQRFDVRRATVTIRDRQVESIQRTYSDSPIGLPLALVGSSGFLEVAVNQGSAAAYLGAEAGDLVEIHLGAG
jgi:S-adenosylmethionine hydrolase